MSRREGSGVQLPEIQLYQTIKLDNTSFLFKIQILRRTLSECMYLEQVGPCRRQKHLSCLRGVKRIATESTQERDRTIIIFVPLCALIVNYSYVGGERGLPRWCKRQRIKRDGWIDSMSGTIAHSRETKHRDPVHGWQLLSILQTRLKHTGLCAVAGDISSL